MNIGLEKEFFLVNQDNLPQLVVGSGAPPIDDCGWLVEARGGPEVSIIVAVYNLKADIHRIQFHYKDFFSKTGTRLIDTPVMKIPRDMRQQAARKFTKGLVSHSNLYGHEAHRVSMLEATAGVHISFTNPGTVYHKDGSSVSYNQNFDWAKLFRKLDAAFKDEIEAAKRRPGFYEIKGDGRVEYRSLPSDVDLDKVISVISQL